MQDWRDTASTGLGKFPTNRAMLIRDETGSLEVVAFIYDAEADLFRVSFGYDETFTIKTEDYSYVMLREPFLNQMKGLLRDAKELWEELEPYLNEDGDFDPPEDLITAPIETPDYEPEP
jgi:hypothetical protein